MNIRMTHIIILGLLLLSSSIVAQQDGTPQTEALFEINCTVDIVDPPLAISRDQVTTAETVTDLNTFYKPSWVTTYHSVVLQTTYQGKPRTANGVDDTLTDEQKDHLRTMDDDTPIEIHILYMPNNSMKHNEEKELHYTLPVYPDVDATFPGGEEALNAYIMDKVLSPMDSSKIKQHQMYNVRFVVDEHGYIIDPVLQHPSKDEKLDSLLLRSVCNMPRWEPARYASGLQKAQTHTLTLGDRYSCTENLINSRATVASRKER